MTPGQHWDLWRHDPRATPFQTPAWLDAWWRHLGGGERRDVVVRDAAGRPVAALPMFVWDDGMMRRLVPVGAGHSDYSDALLDPAGCDAADLLRSIVAQAKKCDEVLLPDLRPDSPLLADLPIGWLAEDAAGEVCPVLSLPEGMAVLASLSKSRRRKVAHDQNRAEQLGGVTVALVDVDGLAEAFDALFALHTARWQAAGEPGVLADRQVQDFHRAAAPALFAAGLLRVAVVRWRERIVAVLLGFCDGRRGYSYINGVETTVPGQSFGTLAFRCLIEATQAEGARAFHFLRGEEPYKYAWGAEPTTTVRRILRRA